MTVYGISNESDRGNSPGASPTPNPPRGIDPNTWLAWAQYYASLGFAVLPLRGKDPAPIKTGNIKPDGKPEYIGVYHASTDPRVWADWLAQYPGCNLGIAIPDGKIAIDVDVKEGRDGFKEAKALEVAFGEEFDGATFAQKSGSGGGYHFVYDAPPGYTYPHNKLENNDGIDVKKLGGYLVAAPSVHPDTSQHYYPVNQDGAIKFAPLPSWLQARLVPRGASKAKALAADEIDDARRDAAGWGLDPDLVVQDVSDEAIAQAVEALAPISQEGNRYNVLVKSGGMLNRLGWSVASVEAFARAYVDQYGGRDPEHGVRGCVNGMKYPSGYHALLEMLPAGPQREALAASLDGLHNPYGVHLREARAASAADVLTRLAKLEKPSLTGNQVTQLENAHSRFGWLADDANDVPIDPIIAGLDIADGRTTGIAGLPHAAKTPTSMLIAACVANGKPWLGRETQQRPVLYVNFEKGFDAVSKRRRIAQGIGTDPKRVELLNLGDKAAFLNDKAGTVDKLTAIVKDVFETTGKVPLVIVDTLANSVAGVEHNAAEYAEPIRTLIVSMRQVCPVPVCVLLHCRKALEVNKRPSQNDIEGSVQIVGICDAIIGLYKPDPTNPNKVTATPVRTLADEQPDITFEWSGSKDEALTCRPIGEGDRKEAPRGPKVESKTERKSRAYSDLSNAVEAAPANHTWDREQIRVAAKCTGKDAKTNEAFEYAVQQLIRDGKIQAWKGSRGAQHFRRLSPADVFDAREAARRTVGLHAHNERMIQDVTSIPGHPPPPFAGGFTPPTASN